MTTETKNQGVNRPAYGLSSLEKYLSIHSETVQSARKIIEDYGQVRWSQEKTSKSSGLKATQAVNLSGLTASQNYKELSGSYYFAQGDHEDPDLRTVYLARFSSGESSMIVAGFRADGRIVDKNREIYHPSEDDLNQFAEIIKFIASGQTK